MAHIFFFHHHKASLPIVIIAIPSHTSSVISSARMAFYRSLLLEGVAFNDDTWRTKSPSSSLSHNLRNIQMVAGVTFTARR